PRRTPPERRVRVVGRHVATPEVAERKAVAGGFGGSGLAQHLVQIPVHPLMAVEKAKDIAPAAEIHCFRRPREAHPGATLAAGGVDHGLLESSERDGDLEHDPAFLEFSEPPGGATSDSAAA